MPHLLYFCVSVAVIWVCFVLLIVRATKVSSEIGTQMDDAEARINARFKIGE